MPPGRTHRCRHARRAIAGTVRLARRAAAGSGVAARCESGPECNQLNRPFLILALDWSTLTGAGGYYGDDCNNR
jgi:hypothetical protein